MKRSTKASNRVLVLRYTDGTTSVIPFTDLTVLRVDNQAYGMVRLEDATVMDADLYDLEVDALAPVDAGKSVAEWDVRASVNGKREESAA